MSLLTAASAWSGKLYPGDVLLALPAVETAKLSLSCGRQAQPCQLLKRKRVTYLLTFPRMLFLNYGWSDIPGSDLF